MVTIRCKNPYFKGAPHGAQFTPKTGGAVARADADTAEKILKDYPASMSLETEDAVAAPAAPAEGDTEKREDQDPPVGGHSSIEAVKGIGKKTADKLAAAGIVTIEDLSKASTDAVMEAAGVDAKKAMDWHLQAMEIVTPDTEES